MSDSSDSEIIQRKRSNKVIRKYYSDDSSSSELVEDSTAIEGCFEPLFFEIFGSGDEYNYIYDTEKPISDIEEKTYSIDRLDPSECYSYITKIISGYKSICKGFDFEILKLLWDGNSVEYCVFHMNKMSIKEMYLIYDLIEEFRQFKTLLAQKNGLKISIDSLRALKLANREETDVKCIGMLNIKEYSENLIAFEKKYVPTGKLEIKISNKSQHLAGNESFMKTGWDDEENDTNLNKEEELLDDVEKENIRKYYKKLINQISSNPLFIDRVYRCHEAMIVDNNEYDSYSINSLYFLQRLFISDSADVDDEVRKYIIQVAYENVHINVDALKLRFFELGILEGENSLAELVDIMISLKTRGKMIAGVFLDQGIFSAVKIATNGDIISSEVFKEHQIIELTNYLTGSDVVCITSTSQNIRYTLLNCHINFLYVPRWLSFFKDKKELSVPYNIAFALQNPILYFSKALYVMKNHQNIANFKYKNFNMVERAIKIACACHKLNWKEIVEHKYGYTLFNILNIKLNESYFDYGSIPSMNSLKEIYDTIEFNNICTYSIL